MMMLLSKIDTIVNSDYFFSTFLLFCVFVSCDSESVFFKTLAILIDNLYKSYVKIELSDLNA